MKEISYTLLNISAQAEALLSGESLNSTLMSGIKPIRMWHLLEQQNQTQGSLTFYFVSWYGISLAPQQSLTRIYNVLFHFTIIKQFHLSFKGPGIFKLRGKTLH